MDVVSLKLAVHETYLDAILVKERCGIGHLGKNELEILNALAAFFELHGSTVICKTSATRRVRPYEAHTNI